MTTQPASAATAVDGVEPACPGLFAQIREDWIAHSRDWTRPGFRAIAAHRIGSWARRIRSRILRAPFTVLSRFLFRRCRNVYGVELPFSVVVGRRVVIEHQGAIVVHGNSRIGDGSVLRQGVTLGIRSVDRPTEAPHLGRNVDVGAGAKILGPVHVGDGAVIGANAVVLRDVPAGAVVAGVPAQIVGRRSPAR